LLIQTLDDNIKYKTRGSLLVPYVEFNFGTALPDLLAAVKVGPILHKDQTAEAIKGLGLYISLVQVPEINDKQ